MGNATPAGVIALQRAAGNRATAAMLGGAASASRRAVARCAGTCTCGGKCHAGRPDEELEALGGRAIARSVMQRQALQRMAPCPPSLADSDPTPPGWRSYPDSTEWFHLQTSAGNRAATQAVGRLLQRQPAKQPTTAERLKELTHVVQQSGSNAGAQALVQRAIPDRTNRRHLTAAEVQEVRLVFGTALATDDVVISEGGLMTFGGYARTVPDRIYFPSGSFGLPLLIHELTHVWQYQRGEGWGSLPGMIWEAVVGNYDYGGEDGLKEAWEKGKAFSEFTTEQQGDILEDYYVRLKAHSDVSAYEPFVNDVRAGRERVHRYKPIEPLPRGTLDVWKANREYRDKQEAELIRELRKPMSPDDPRAVTRANRLLAWFGNTYWTDYYRERIVAQRSDDVLVQLLYSQLGPATRKRIFARLGVDKSVAP
jgi:hypothetical protein